MLDVIQNIHDKYAGMTKKQKDIAAFMLADPERMSFITLKELSAATHVSEMTVLNACSYLGYANFNELKYQFRQYILGSRRILMQQDNDYQHPYIPSRDLTDRESFLHQICSEEMTSFSSFLSQIDPSQYFDAARVILEKRFVVMCGRGISLQLLDFMSMRLAITGIPSICINTELNDAIQTALPLLSDDALLLAFSFPDYYFMTTTLVQYAHQKGAFVLGITDSPRSDIVPFCDLTLYCPTSTHLFLNTLSSGMALVNILSSAISIELSMGSRDLSAASREFAALFEDKE